MNGLERLAGACRGLQGASDFVRCGGRVVRVTPSVVEAAGLSPFVSLGDLVELPNGGDEASIGEVVRVDEDHATIKLYAVEAGVGTGTPVWRRGGLVMRPHEDWKGRVLDAFGRAVDGKPQARQGETPRNVDAAPPAAMARASIHEGVRTGVRVIDLFTPLCAGQRIGVFAGSGVGKTTLLGMLARARGFDSVVIALVGERGREVRDFLDNALGAYRTKTVCIVATADESPMMRRLAPRTAMCVAEHFRDQGEKVLLLIDSVTRLAHALREVALAAGEPPVARGFPPSVFSDLPRFLERAGPGPSGGGSITGFFSILVDGDDHNDPVADSIRGTLDGHIVLSRGIADQGRFPAVDISASLSRLAERVLTPQQRELASALRAHVSRYEETRDLRLMGGYQRGTDPALDHSLAVTPRLYSLMRQGPDSPVSEDVFGEAASLLQSGAGASSA